MNSVFARWITNAVARISRDEACFWSGMAVELAGLQASGSSVVAYAAPAVAATLFMLAYATARTRFWKALYLFVAGVQVFAFLMKAFGIALITALFAS